MHAISYSRKKTHAYTAYTTKIDIEFEASMLATKIKILFLSERLIIWFKYKRC